MLVEPQSRRVGFQTDVFQWDLLDEFVSLCGRITINLVTLLLLLEMTLAAKSRTAHFLSAFPRD